MTCLHVRTPALLSQVLLVNTLLIGATVIAGAAAGQLDWQAEQRQGLVLIAAVLSTVLVNGLVLRRRFAPLERIITTMERVDLAERGVRVGDDGADSLEVLRLHQAFDRMVERLEHERHEAAAAVLRAQEAERARLARDLHDEANQALTAVLLRLQAAQHAAPPELVDELRATQAVATQAMDELLRLARELRPAALDDHGLAEALRTMARRFGDDTGLAVECLVDDAVDALDPDEQIVVYRVVQESLSNVVQHSGAGTVRVEVDGHGVVVRDDGRGLGLDAGEGHGISGMRERALLAGGRLEVRSARGGGTEVELVLDDEEAVAA